MRRVIAVALLLSASLFAKSALPTPAPPLKLKSQPVVKPGTKAKGRWHMAENGHAVYCYGPVIIMNAFSWSTEPKRYATQCRGTISPVPLRD
jgi:hypothetical protein